MRVPDSTGIFLFFQSLLLFWEASKDTVLYVVNRMSVNLREFCEGGFQLFVRRDLSLIHI